jgi:hypothetical protein
MKSSDMPNLDAPQGNEAGARFKWHPVMLTKEM